EGAVRVITDAATVYMPMKELVDFNAELARLNKDLEKVMADKEFFEKKLNNPGFVAKAPASLVEQQKSQLEKVLEKIKVINENIADIKKNI
ncbi:MAG: valine--tRNA ligase, partial [Acutalibacteraceae bacterium]